MVPLLPTFPPMVTLVTLAPMVPLAAENVQGSLVTYGTIGKISNGPIGRIPNARPVSSYKNILYLKQVSSSLNIFPVLLVTVFQGAGCYTLSHVLV